MGDSADNRHEGQWMIRVNGTLKVSVDDTEGRLEASGDRLVFDADNLRTFLQGGGGAGQAGLSTLRLIAAELHNQGLTLEIRDRGKPIVLLGRETKPGMLGWAMGVPHFSLLSTTGAMSLFLGR
jgi:hypothetical protein